MKIQKKKQISQIEIINKPHIIRSVQIKRFWDEYKLHKNDTSPEWLISILNYYGMGGIGKTELANELCNQLSDQGLNYIFFTFNGKISFIENIIELRNVLFNKFRIEFPMFDIAYISYCKKSGRRIGELETSAILSSKWMEVIYPILGTVPRVNISIAVLQAIKPFEKEMRYKFNEQSFEFCKDSPDKLYEKLMFYFCSDLQNYLETTQPISIFLDNVDDILLKEGYAFNEWFLSKKGLLQQLPNITWCIFSRVKIDESCFDEKVVQYILVNGFTFEEVKKYLRECKIDEQYWLAIFELTEGIPLYLDICIEMYYMLIRNRKQIDILELGSDKGKLLLSFYKYFNDVEKKVLHIMAFLEMWEEEQMNVIVSTLGISRSIYNLVLQQSFIKKSGKKYYIHSVVATVIQDHISADAYDDLKEIFEKKEVLDTMSNTQKELIILNINLCKIRDISELDIYIFNLSIYFEKYLKNLDICTIYKLRCMISERLFKIENNILSHSVAYFYHAKVLQKLGFLDKAYESYEVAYNIVCSVERPTYMKQCAYDYYATNIREEYANALQYCQKYEESRIIREKILEQSIKKYGRKKYETIVAQQNLYTLFIYMNDFRDKGIMGLKTIINRREKLIIKDNNIICMNAEHIIWAKQSLADGYEKKNDLEMAIKYSAEAYFEALEMKGEQDYYTQSIANRLADMLMTIREYELVIKLTEGIYATMKEIISDGNVLLNSMRYTLGVAYGASGRIEEGKNLLRECYEYAHDTWGIVDKRTLMYKKEYAICLAYEKQHEEAIEMLLDCKELYESTYGLDGEDQLFNIYDCLVKEYHILRIEDKAEDIARQAINAGFEAEIFKQILGRGRGVKEDN